MRIEVRMLFAATALLAMEGCSIAYDLSKPIMKNGNFNDFKTFA